MHHITLYLEFWAIYEEQLQLDVKAYKADLEHKKADLKQLIVEVETHTKDLDELDRWFVFTLFNISKNNLKIFYENFVQFFLQ